MHYQVIESKLNHMSLEELGMHDPDTYTVLINKLLHLSLIERRGHITEIKVLANIIASKEVPRERTLKDGYIYYSPSKEQWIAGIYDGKRSRTIKSSKHKEVVESFLNDYRNNGKN